MLKKWSVVLIILFTLNTLLPIESFAATNTHAIQELKKIKAAAKQGKTIRTGALKINSPYEKFFKKYGKPIYTFTPKGAVFEDHFTNSVVIYTSGKLNPTNWALKRQKNDRVYTISVPYTIDYKHIKKVFGTKKTMNYASGDYFISYKTGKYTVVFQARDDYDSKKLYNNTYFYHYSVTKN